MQTYDAFASDYVTATVIQQALGGHAIPIDKSAHRVLERVGVSESEVPALRAVLERAVPKNRGVEFLDLLEDVANDVCHEGVPECPRCELRKICTYALTHKAGAHAPAHAATATATATATAKTTAPRAAKAAAKPAKAEKAEVSDASSNGPKAAKRPAKAPKDVAPPPPPAPKPSRDKHRGSK